MRKLIAIAFIAAGTVLMAAPSKARAEADAGVSAGTSAIGDGKA